MLSSLILSTNSKYITLYVWFDDYFNFTIISFDICANLFHSIAIWVLIKCLINTHTRNKICSSSTLLHVLMSFATQIFRIHNDFIPAACWLVGLHSMPLWRGTRLYRFTEHIVQALRGVVLNLSIFCWHIQLIIKHLQSQLYTNWPPTVDLFTYRRNIIRWQMRKCCLMINVRRDRKS